jgi:hypothetical protein
MLPAMSFRAGHLPPSVSSCRSSRDATRRRASTPRPSIGFLLVGKPHRRIFRRSQWSRLTPVVVTRRSTVAGAMRYHPSSSSASPAVAPCHSVCCHDAKAVASPPLSSSSSDRCLVEDRRRRAHPVRCPPSTLAAPVRALLAPLVVIALSSSLMCRR